MRISVIGLGKLGACTAACFASKGFEVIGVDINKDFVDAINEGRAPVVEPRLQELITGSKGRLKATQSYKEALEQSDITLLIVPTPSMQDGNFSDKYLQDALTHLAEAFKRTNKKYHLFVVTSTVSPGTTEKNLIPLIESVSGKKLNKDFGVCYNPEFIALGSVIYDFLNPDMVLIGESNEFAGDKLEQIYQQACESQPYIARMSIVSAEISKISLNSYVTMKISFANALGTICDSIPGANIDDITRALGADKRIGTHYIKSGLGYGGPCFPRDNRAFASFARAVGHDAVLAKATDSVNQVRLEYLVDIIMNHLSNCKSDAISILGLSYKPGVPVIEESAGVKMIEEILKKKDIKVIAYDPLAMDNVRAHFGDTILYASSIKECFVHSSLCVITTPAQEFQAIDESYVMHNPTTIIDCWRTIQPSKLTNKIQYVALGRKT